MITVPNQVAGLWGWNEIIYINPLEEWHIGTAYYCCSWVYGHLCPYTALLSEPVSSVNTQVLVNSIWSLSSPCWFAHFSLIWTSCLPYLHLVCTSSYRLITLLDWLSCLEWSSWDMTFISQVRCTALSHTPSSSGATRTQNFPWIMRSDDVGPWSFALGVNFSSIPKSLVLSWNKMRVALCVRMGNNMPLSRRGQLAIQVVVQRRKKD